MSKMNEQLQNLYSNKWPLVTERVQDKAVSPAAQPLLIKVNEQYENARLKVIIFGQETDGWHEEFNSYQASVEQLMDRYYRYFNRLSEGGKKRQKRAFWGNKNFNFFAENLAPKKDVEFLWNNISKIGNNETRKGKPHKSIRVLEREYFNVIREEVEILKPDLIIFTTGKRDSYIRHIFGDKTSFAPLLYLQDGKPANETLNLIAEVSLEDFPAISAIRVEHPNRRTLDKALILKLIENCWNKKRSQ